MATMRIGFAKTDITPPLGTELAGYAGYRPCSGVHDPLWCKAVVLEQNGQRYALVVLDLMCVDESLQLHIARALEQEGIAQQRLIVSAIHTHAAPRGGIPGEGPLARVNGTELQHVDAFRDYMDHVISAARQACAHAAQQLEAFQIRCARGDVPAVGTERHTGGPSGGNLTVLQVRTDSGKNMILYNFPCHPTVLNAANLQVSADFAGTVGAYLDADMTMFVNGAAGDVSTRFTRREASFAECERMGALVAAQVKKLLENRAFGAPEPLKGIHTKITLRAREIETVDRAQKRLEETTARWQKALANGADPGTVRILKSYVEGAGVSLGFAHSMAGIHQLHLPVTAFRFCGLDFVSIPGELFSALQPKDVSVIGYANGYYRYIGGEPAYEAAFYEALAAIIARGEGERLMGGIAQLRTQLDRI